MTHVVATAIVQFATTCGPMHVSMACLGFGWLNASESGLRSPGLC